METEYPKSDANGSLSDASTIPRNDNTPAEGLDGAGGSYQNKNSQLDREYCAIGRESKKAGNGRQALEHTRAVRMAIYSARVILASFGIFAANLMDIWLDWP